MKSRKLQLASAIWAGMVLAFLIAPARSVAQVQQSGQNLINSTVNSTPIGQSSPAAAAVTQLQVTSNPGSLSSQGAWLGFNKATLGETDFFTAPGSGEGGYLWYNTTSFTQLMQLDYTGTLTALKSVVAPNMLVNGNNTLNAGTGENFAWNLSGGNGESDFVTLYQSGGVGGFNWYNTPTSASKGTAVMALNGSGVLNVPGGITANLTGAVTGNVTGNVSGNAATATALAASPSNCGAGAVAYGVNASGNALCGTVHVLGITISSGGAGICTTAATPYAQCSQTYYLSPDGTASGSVTFASAPAVSCNSSGAIGTNAYLGALTVSSISTTQFTVSLQNGGTSGAEGASSASYLNCTAIHN